MFTDRAQPTVLENFAPSDQEGGGAQSGRGPVKPEVQDVKEWLQKLTDLASLARSGMMLKQALTDVAQELGFDCYAYLNVRPVGTNAVSNYASEWQKLYFEHDYSEIDPVVSTARERMRAFSWAAGSPRQALSKQERRFYAHAADFGIRSGITIPVRTPFGHMSMLTLASAKTALSLDRDIDQVAAVTAVAFLHAAFDHQDVESSARTNVELTARQALCLRWSAEGKTMRDIASIEDMSYATVNFHLNNARKALDAVSLTQATALATKLKLI